MPYYAYWTNTLIEHTADCSVKNCLMVSVIRMGWITAEYTVVAAAMVISHSTLYNILTSYVTNILAPQIKEYVSSSAA